MRDEVVTHVARRLRPLTVRGDTVAPAVRHQRLGQLARDQIGRDKRVHRHHAIARVIDEAEAERSVDAGPGVEGGALLAVEAELRAARGGAGDDELAALDLRIGDGDGGLRAAADASRAASVSAPATGCRASEDDDAMSDAPLCEYQPRRLFYSPQA